MTDTITLASGSLADFLDRLGLSQTARDRVVEIDRTLAEELESEKSNADRCADIVLEVADLVSGPLLRRTPATSGFDFNAMDWGSDDGEAIDHV